MKLAANLPSKNHTPIASRPDLGARFSAEVDATVASHPWFRAGCGDILIRSSAQDAVGQQAPQSKRSLPASPQT
jgi:hypothetical protein